MQGISGLSRTRVKDLHFLVSGGGGSQSYHIFHRKLGLAFHADWLFGRQLAASNYSVEKKKSEKGPFKQGQAADLWPLAQLYHIYHKYWDNQGPVVQS